MPLFFFLAFVLLLYMVYRHYQDYKDFPPGLPRWPLVGCLPYLGGNFGSRLIIASTDLYRNKGYGAKGLIGYSVGRVKFVFIQDFDLAKKVAFDDAFNSRLDIPYLRDFRGYEGRRVGLAMTEGETWRSHRRFALSTLKEFGFGKAALEDVIAEEASEAVDRLVDLDGQDFEVDQTFNIPVFNILWRIVAGRRYEHRDPHILDLQRLLAEAFKHAFKEMPFPIISYLFPALVKAPEKRKHTAAMKAMFEEVVDEIIQDFDPDERPRHLIDSYLLEMSKNKDDKTFNRYDLIGLCMDFFEAGGETVGSTLAWLLMYLALHPQEQEKCHQEIVGVLGSSVPTLAKRRLLPYTEATIMETQRLSCVAPGGIGNFTLRQMDIAGYKIPPQTNVHYNIHGFHTDPEYWGDPKAFRPSRFLKETDDGSLKIHRPERFVPFGMGRRVCMGESMAKDELLVFAVIIMQRLKISLPLSSPAPSPDEDVSGFTRSPLPFKVHLGARQQR